MNILIQDGIEAEIWNLKSETKLNIEYIIINKKQHNDLD